MMISQNYSTRCSIAASASKQVGNTDGSAGYFSLNPLQECYQEQFAQWEEWILVFFCVAFWFWCSKCVILAMLLSESLFSCVSCACWFHLSSKNPVQLTSCLKINLKAFPLNVFLVHINATNRFKNWIATTVITECFFPML